MSTDVSLQFYQPFLHVTVSWLSRLSSKTVCGNQHSSGAAGLSHSWPGCPSPGWQSCRCAPGRPGRLQRPRPAPAAPQHRGQRRGRGRAAPVAAAAAHGASRLAPCPGAGLGGASPSANRARAAGALGPRASPSTGRNRRALRHEFFHLHVLEAPVENCVGK